MARTIRFDDNAAVRSKSQRAGWHAHIRAVRANYAKKILPDSLLAPRYGKAEEEMSGTAAHRGGNQTGRPGTRDDRAATAARPAVSWP